MQIVGNIPFELTEEQLIEVFKEVGPVASFRYRIKVDFTVLFLTTEFFVVFYSIVKLVDLRAMAFASFMVN